MKEVARYFVVLAVCLFAVISPSFGANKPISAEEILAKAIAQAKVSASNSAPYQFTQITITEERDANGCVKERKQDSGEVSGSTASFLKSIRSPKPANASNSDRLKLKKYQCNNRSDALNYLTPELVAKYTLRLVQQTNINGRTTYELEFQPKDKSAEAKEFVERILNQAHGKLWIDCEEFEVAKAEVSLDSEVTVGGGILGSLKKALVVLERIRLDGGVWLDRFYKTDYEARKLVASKRVVTWCEAKNFRKLAPQG